ncbi:rRNA methylase [Limosilactobacillus equigenerosi DSM 18793 = JCM 14505]|uniref:rRNA methylase n=1 Tax=Limosilactobacillus equigenerosi DSM 18793 = JCM 14505 TaxID=1423742 RepID=A0A0R1UQZ4_9LACO|nr:rRNA methylase [Limosilactobacillus equigenerosi DSM 18793 = JCM 14505]
MIVERITSSQNQRVKDWKKLSTKKGRQKQGQYLLDGWHLVQEVVKAGQPIETLIGTSDELQRHADIVAQVADVVEVTPEIMHQVMGTVTPQGIAAIVDLPVTAVTTVPTQGKWLLLDRVQDPGNLGTMVRTADAAGFAGVIAGTGTTDYFSPKVVRSMQGSQFHLQLLTGDLATIIPALQANQIPVYGSELNPEAISYQAIPKTDSLAIVMGNEGQGMAADLLQLTTKNVYIPMPGQAESLNVAVSAGILMFSVVE